MNPAAEWRSEYQYQGNWNASLKPKTTHEKYPAERTTPAILTV